MERGAPDAPVIRCAHGTLARCGSGTAGSRWLWSESQHRLVTAIVFRCYEPKPKPGRTVSLGYLLEDEKLTDTSEQEGPL